ncbi:MAG: hypothetical protein KDC54_04230 [Lewinella sp.]|nr:hypothetical protein [Lewinella sp.]
MANVLVRLAAWNLLTYYSNDMKGRTLGIIALIVVIGLIATRFLMKPYSEDDAIDLPIPRCDMPVAQDQVKAVYLLGSLYPDDLDAYVRDNFRSVETMDCFTEYCQDFGQFLINAGYQAFPGNELRESAYEIAGDTGMGPDVYQGMVESSLDLAQLGQMIQGFPAIVHGLRKGDATAYRQSLMGQVNALLTQMDPSLRVFYDQIMQANRPGMVAFVNDYLGMLMVRYQAFS